jgi:hypothetical protein
MGWCVLSATGLGLQVDAWRSDAVSLIRFSAIAVAYSVPAVKLIGSIADKAKSLSTGRSAGAVVACGAALDGAGAWSIIAR